MRAFGTLYTAYLWSVFQGFSKEKAGREAGFTYGRADYSSG